MFARTARYEIPVDGIEEEIQQFRQREDEVRRLAGNLGVFYFIDRDNGHALSMTLWEDEAALRASEEAAARLREQIVEPVRAKVVTVERYEVIHAEMRDMGTAYRAA